MDITKRYCPVICTFMSFTVFSRKINFVPFLCGHLQLCCWHSSMHVAVFFQKTNKNLGFQARKNRVTDILQATQSGSSEKVWHEKDKKRKLFINPSPLCPNIWSYSSMKITDILPPLLLLKKLSLCNPYLKKVFCLTDAEWKIEITKRFSFFYSFLLIFSKLILKMALSVRLIL